MKKKTLFFLLGCLSYSLLSAQTSGDSLLAARLDSLIEHQLPKGSNVGLSVYDLTDNRMLYEGLSVYDLTDNRMLYEYQADRLSRPASTMKLVTAITALAQPEFDEPFRTEVWYRGRVEADTLHGDLYVVGGFDPEFDEEDLDSLVSATARAPFSVIKGRVYGDVSMKDSLYWGSGWLWDDNPSWRKAWCASRSVPPRQAIRLRSASALLPLIIR